MKLYRIPLYQASYHKYCSGSVSYVDDIIVMVKCGKIKEIMTGYSKISVYSTEVVSKEQLDYHYWNSSLEKKYGAHLFCYQSSFCATNCVTEAELNEYINNYENSKWKEKYDSMKILTKGEKKELRKKVNSVFGSKK